MSDGANGTFKNFGDVLAASRFNEERPIKHIVENASRFAIDVDFHLAYSAAQLGEVFCLPLLDARLSITEKADFDVRIWALRKEKLNIMLNALEYPHFEMTDGLYNFDVFFAAIVEAQKMYGTTNSIEWRKWLGHAESVLKNYSRISVAGRDPKSRRKHQGIVAGWLLRLREIQSVKP